MEFGNRGLTTIIPPTAIIPPIIPPTAMIPPIPETAIIPPIPPTAINSPSAIIPSPAVRLWVIGYKLNDPL